jgi:outer membrane protein TolC
MHPTVLSSCTRPLQALLVATSLSASSVGPDYRVPQLPIAECWGLDLFGGQRRQLEAATAQLGASDADLRDVLVTLLGDVNARAAQSRPGFAERNLTAQAEIVTTPWPSQAGLADGVYFP